MTADDDNVTPEQRNREHMERVRAVHRRAAYERVMSRIVFYRTWEREAAAGLRPPMPEDCHAHLSVLLELRDELEAELTANSQGLR